MPTDFGDWVLQRWFYYSDGMGPAGSAAEGSSTVDGRLHGPEAAQMLHAAGTGAVGAAATAVPRTEPSGGQVCAPTLPEVDKGDHAGEATHHLASLCSLVYIRLY